MVPPRLEVREKGLLPYADGLVLQEQTREEVRRGSVDGVILALRHPPTLTLGRRARFEEVHVSRAERRRLGVELYYVERGGGATYHGPDQAVVYPIVHLSRLGIGVEDVIQCLADATLRYLRGFEVEASWDDSRPGVYVAGAKIASVGLQVSLGITMHGLAVHIGPNLSGFSLIDPCKCPNLEVTSLSRLADRVVDPDAAAASLARLVADGLQTLARSDKISTGLGRTRRPRGDPD